MAQIALPYRIGLGAVLVLLVAYFAVLKPKDSPTPPPAAPGVAGLTTAVDKANGAVAASDASAAAAQAAAGQAGGETTPGAAAVPAPVTPGGAAPATPATPNSTVKDALANLEEGDRSASILREIAAGKTAVVLFSSPLASDDHHVRRVLSMVNRHGGKVAVHRVGIADVGEYDALTRGAQVTQAPTLLVVGKSLKARSIVGYTTRTEVEQVVNDVSGLRVSQRPSSYRNLIASACATTLYNINGDYLSLEDFLGRGSRLAAMRDDIRRLSTRLRGATVPARYASFHASYLGYLSELNQMVGTIAQHATSKRTAGDVRRFRSSARKLDDRAHAAGLPCTA